MKLLIILYAILILSAANGKATSFKSLANLIREDLAAEEKNTRSISTTINNYADKVFQHISNLTIESGYDPSSLPDIDEELSYTIILITYHGGLHLTSGQLNGISTLHRGGDVKITYDTITKKLTVVAPVYFDVLNFVYDYNAEIMSLGPSGKVTGTMKNIQVRVTIGFDFEKLVASLDELYVLNSGSISLKFSGNILFDWLLNLLTTVATTALHRVILLFVEKIVQDGVSSVINLINNDLDKILGRNSTQTDNAIYKLFL